MNDASGNRRRSGKPPDRRGGGGGGGGDEAPSGIAILAFLAAVALACVGGYFLVMKLIEISRQEDCILAGGRYCVPPIELPSNR
jgi:hypothetical protein